MAHLLVIESSVIRADLAGLGWGTTRMAGRGWAVFKPRKRNSHSHTPLLSFCRAVGRSVEIAVLRSALSRDEPSILLYSTLLRPASGSVPVCQSVCLHTTYFRLYVHTWTRGRRGYGAVQVRSEPTASLRAWLAACMPRNLLTPPPPPHFFSFAFAVQVLPVRLVHPIARPFDRDATLDWACPMYSQSRVRWDHRFQCYTHAHEASRRSSYKYPTIDKRRPAKGNRKGAWDQDPPGRFCFLCARVIANFSMLFRLPQCCGIWGPAVPGRESFQAYSVVRSTYSLQATVPNPTICTKSRIGTSNGGIRAPTRCVCNEIHS